MLPVKCFGWSELRGLCVDIEVWVEQDSAVKGGQKSAKGGLGSAVLGPSPDWSVGW